MHNEFRVTFKKSKLKLLAAIFVLSNIVLNCIIVNDFCTKGYKLFETLVVSILATFVITFLVFFLLLFCFIIFKGKINTVYNKEDDKF